MGDPIGHARVSTEGQTLALQTDALDAAGCIRTFSDRASGRLDDRPQLAAALDHLRPGDVLVVWRLDRLGRSLPHLVATVSTLGERGVQFRSLTEGIDTTTPAGELVFHLMAALAQFEAALLSERTTAGLAAARARGRVGGRPVTVNAEQVRAAREMHAAGRSWDSTAALLTVSRSSLFRALRRHRASATAEP